jgi:anti-sigma28 factor (negative regulator of flagellin synthesis)
LSAPDLPSRADKIAQLRQAVEYGAYCVSAEQIAEKIVQELLAEIFTSGLRR